MPKTDVDGMTIENTCCLIRNLCYRFGPESYLNKDNSDLPSNYSLFCPSVIPLYLSVLMQSSNLVTTEAVIGTIQNLTSNSKFFTVK